MDRDTGKSRIELRRLTVPDAVVIVLILVLSLALVAQATFGSWGSSSQPIEAAIYHDGKLLKRIHLRPDRLISLEDGKMLVEIKDGKIRVQKSECPHQVCLRVGWIAHPGEVITCVPYKTVIEIGSAGNAAVDVVVF